MAEESASCFRSCWPFFKQQASKTVAVRSAPASTTRSSTLNQDTFFSPPSATEETECKSDLSSASKESESIDIDVVFDQILSLQYKSKMKDAESLSKTVNKYEKNLEAINTDDEFLRQIKIRLILGKSKEIVDLLKGYCGQNSNRSAIITQAIELQDTYSDSFKSESYSCC